MARLVSPAFSQDIARGKAVYEKHCAQCHGAAGTPYRLDPSRPGQYIRDRKEVPLIDARAAPGAGFFHPRPRDLTGGVFKLRSTPNGALPTDEDIVRTISEGMPGSAMPAWKGALTSEEIRDVSGYVKTFSKRFALEKPGRTVDLDPLPQTADSLKNGKKLYLDANCFLCHGMKGRGDGDVGLYRRDAADQNNKVSAADLSKRWNFRAGPRVGDIYKSIVTGLTLMPGHEKSFGEGPQARRKAWDLAYYVDSLSREKPDATGVLAVYKTTGTLPGSEKDPVWDAMAAQDVFMAGQVIRAPRYYEPSVNMISVRGLFDAKELVLLLEWNDPRKNIAPIADSVEVQLPLALDGKGGWPHFLEGDLGHPVLLWKWDASREKISVFKSQGPASKKIPLPSSAIGSSASYAAGRWRLLIRRKLTAEFLLNRPIPVAFAAWDGDPGEREETGLRRSISGWNALVLLPARDAGLPPLPWAKAPRATELPAKFAKLKNPYPGDARRTLEGKAIYAQKCLVCHGDLRDGQGPFARAFYPRPASFKAWLAADAYLFWRIATGAPGLPAGARPWASAMPAWGGELSEEAIWSLVLYLKSDY